MRGDKGVGLLDTKKRHVVLEAEKVCPMRGSSGPLQVDLSDVQDTRVVIDHNLYLLFCSGPSAGTQDTSLMPPHVR